MTPPLRDFVSTCRPPIQPEPFFGFFLQDHGGWKKKKRRVKAANERINKIRKAA